MSDSFCNMRTNMKPCAPMRPTDGKPAKFDLSHLPKEPSESHLREMEQLRLQLQYRVDRDYEGLRAAERAGDEPLAEHFRTEVLPRLWTSSPARIVGVRFPEELRRTMFVKEVRMRDRQRCREWLEDQGFSWPKRRGDFHRKLLTFVSKLWRRGEDDWPEKLFEIKFGFVYLDRRPKKRT